MNKIICLFLASLTIISCSNKESAKEDSQNQEPNLVDTSTIINSTKSTDTVRKDSSIVKQTPEQHTSSPKVIPPVPAKVDVPSNSPGAFNAYIIEYTKKVNEFISLATRASKGDTIAMGKYANVYREILPIQTKIESIQMSMGESKRYEMMKKRFLNVAENMK